MPVNTSTPGVRGPRRGPYLLPALLAMAGGLGLNAQTAPPGPIPQEALRPLPVMMGARGPQTAAQTGQQPPRPVLEPLPVTQIEERQARPELEGGRFSLNFAEPVPLGELLMLLVRETQLNVVVPPDLEATFSGDLKNVTLREALDLILPPHGLDYEIDDRTLRVFKREMRTRIYNIDYISTLRGGSRSMSASSSAGGGAGLSGAGNPAGGVTGSAGTAGGTGGGSGGGGGSAAQVSAVDTGDMFAQLEDGIANLQSPDGRFNLDRKASLLQVIDFPENLRRIEFYLESVMRRLHRQVVIEAKVLEVELRDEFSAGINWSLILGSATGNNVTAGQTLAPSTSGGFTIGLALGNLSALVSAFETQGKVSVLSSPRVTAMNNEPALMRAGTQDIFFVTTTQVDPQTGRILQSAVVPQSITEGVVLSVTPQISADGIVHMSISPSVTERTGQATSRLGDTVPIISVRETDTVVRAHQGETVVIAGLMQERTGNDVSKVPILGSLPGIGAAFRRTQKTVRKTELVILLSATIVPFDQQGLISAVETERILETQRRKRK